MHFLLTVLAFLVIFSALILVHECGHFFMAKRQGIKVEEFGLGLPPRIWGKKWGETLYSFNWIPFGGFVKMLGEDAGRISLKRFNPKNFAHKTVWQRITVVVAGVVMNFVFAWLLFSIGFGVGMQPLIVTGDGLLASIASHQIKVVDGVLVDKVDEGSWAELNGFKEGDRILTVNELPISSMNMDTFLTLMDSDEGFTLNDKTFMPDAEFSSPGLAFDLLELPRVELISVEAGAPLQIGDRILSINGEAVFYAEDLAGMLAQANVGGSTHSVIFEFVRNGETQRVDWPLPVTRRVLISDVLSDSPAEEAGVLEGDLLLRVDGIEVYTAENALAIVEASELETVQYEVQRGVEVVILTMTRNEDTGLIGVYLSSVFESLNLPFSYYDGIETASILSIENVRYSWFDAPFVAFHEMKQVTWYTAKMTAGVFSKIFMTAQVPEGVSGPVGIAQMTGTHVDEGWVALIRFTALLSLSLGVINLFPFPALDGGRLFFLLLEGIRGKPVPAKFENWLHFFGFWLLIMVLFLVTFQDLGRLFAGFSKYFLIEIRYINFFNFF
ncbi:MAG: RIP metalloprotease RseP [Candidatus Gracilibacteria bacterium]